MEFPIYDREYCCNDESYATYHRRGWLQFIILTSFLSISEDADYI